MTPVGMVARARDSWETSGAIPLGETRTKMTRFVLTVGSGLFACLLGAFPAALVCICTWQALIGMAEQSQSSAGDAAVIK